LSVAQILNYRLLGIRQFSFEETKKLLLSKREDFLEPSAELKERVNPDLAFDKNQNLPDS
jgi:hypothetical protein